MKIIKLNNAMTADGISINVSAPGFTVALKYSPITVANIPNNTAIKILPNCNAAYPVTNVMWWVAGMAFPRESNINETALI